MTTTRPELPEGWVWTWDDEPDALGEELVRYYTLQDGLTDVALVSQLVSGRWAVEMFSGPEIDETFASLELAQDAVLEAAKEPRG